MSFPRYAAYKDSGVEWLGEVPQGWGVVPLKWYSSCKSGDSITSTNTEQQIDELNTVPAIGGNGVMGFTSKSNIETPILVVGRVGALCGNVHHIKPPAWISDNALILSISASFSLRYLCLTLFSRNLNDIASKTAQPLITGTQVTEQRIPFPPIQEQTTIAAFLDNETAKIDNLINEQKKLIELLKEKRQAVISTAVTKGLNPHAPMKDSGVEWLGEVPMGWEVKPIKKLGNIVSGYAFPSSDFVKEGEIRVLKISNIQTGYLDWSDESYLPKSSYIDNFSVKNGDIIFALTRPIISTGIKAAVATIGEGEIVLLNQRNALFRPFPIAERKFLYYILFDYNFKAAFENCIDSTGQQPNISPIDIGNIFVAVPPINEQTTIVAFLDQETAKIDNLIQQAQKATTLLQERRTALISAAVTGKIDVRGFVTTNTTANCVGK